MTRRTLTTVLAAPLIFAFLALVALARLDGPIAAFESQHEQTAARSSVAIRAIDSGHLAPSPEQVSAVLKANAKALEEYRNLVVSLWSVIKVGSWLALFGGLAQAFYCFTVYRNDRRKNSGSNVL